MTQKIRKHSEGMISINAEDFSTSRSSILFVKQTELFGELVRIVGKEQANIIVERGAQDFPTESSTVNERRE
jgi:hypothetical protein